MKSHFRLVRELGGDDVPVFRGQLASAQNIAREVISLEHGPFMRDLRERFERTTGIDCSAWCLPETNEHGGFDHARAVADARAFLESDGAAAYDPRRPYFFGRPIVP